MNLASVLHTYIVTQLGYQDVVATHQESQMIVGLAPHQMRPILSNRREATQDK